MRSERTLMNIETKKKNQTFSLSQFPFCRVKTATTTTMANPTFFSADLNKRKLQKKKFSGYITERVVRFLLRRTDDDDDAYVYL